MNIIVFGKNGMLGNYIYTYLTLSKNFNIIFGTERKIFDVYDLFINRNLIEKIQNYIKEYKPSYIINCIGNINKQDYEINKYYIINSYFPIILSKICKENNIIMIHPTTDCVFSGYEGFYDNNFIPNPIDNYGLSKFLGENIEACVIRSSIIGFEKYNPRSLINWIISNNYNNINGYINHKWNGITCLEYAKLVYEIIKEKKHWTGIKSFYSKYKGNDFITKYDLIQEIINIYNLNIVVTAFKTENNCDRTLRGILIENDLINQIKELKDFNEKLF